MAGKKRTTKQIVSQDFPGWKVVDESTVRTPDARETAADAATPPLEEIEAKLGAAAASRRPRADSRRPARRKPVKHAKFVTIAPASQTDAPSHQQKVILIRDGKVVAQQG